MFTLKLWNKKDSEIYGMNMIGFIKRLWIKLLESRNEKKFEIKLSVEIFKWLEVAIAHDKDRDGEENGHAGAKFSGDEQQGDQLGLGTRGARVGMSWISKKEVSGTKDKTE